VLVTSKLTETVEPEAAVAGAFRLAKLKGVELRPKPKGKSVCLPVVF